MHDLGSSINIDFPSQLCYEFILIARDWPYRLVIVDSGNVQEMFAGRNLYVHMLFLTRTVPDNKFIEQTANFDTEHQFGLN